MKITIQAQSVQINPVYRDPVVIEIEVQLTKAQVLAVLDQVAKNVAPRELIRMLDSVLECAGVER